MSLPSDDHSSVLNSLPRSTLKSDAGSALPSRGSDAIVQARTASAKLESPLILVETAFLASAASLIWFINAYFPVPLLRLFFSIPIALVYLRWHSRAAWMAALVSGLLLTVLMGPTRSILFVMPYGFLGVLLGTCWRRGVNWSTSISLGTLLCSIGLFFRIWLTSVLAGEDLWLYTTTIIRGWLGWAFLKLGFLFEPNLLLVQLGAIMLVFVNALVYLFVVHLAAWWLLRRLGNPIPDPPEWVEILLEG
jgi:uncharacterized protein YybS (DUF2232 family)